ncbi:hypothetical protein K08M3_49280 [Vibrio alginolyticus]|jgi:hypothetical protein|uniref:Swiss Army Knife 2H phosphoesterase domain-containing protein n=1 Tax=Vibrio alginolyticus TaxID=663 RepID=A0A1W6TLK6_VIBAL|nr:MULTISPECIES: hypothetical protein [Vibrio harveyi group]ARP06438.1 hypothetical protein K04M1_49150 [Vibrio alginolyticus]ARP11543.1 hypothetical protein K04M3_49740 [Vibrio alginolyticus]ARP16624.1 hypothetical protein K04M5_49720 [Vibrio alginolyticus]ARP21643.1 hypothetical protein K05K4_49340 [Vibrio alginolyticus]ARP26724.1 hypothetical protein K06K5_49240 [Vibrio alginolyticus]
MQTELLKDKLGNEYLAVIVPECLIRETLNSFYAHVGESEFSQMTQRQQIRDRGHYHLTALISPEFHLLKEEQQSSLVNQAVDLQILGLGRVIKDEQRCYYAVASSAAIAHLRESLGLPVKDLHITLGFTQYDIHGVDKGITTLIKGVSNA